MINLRHFPLVVPGCTNNMNRMVKADLYKKIGTPVGEIKVCLLFFLQLRSILAAMDFHALSLLSASRYRLCALL